MPEVVNMSLLNGILLTGNICFMTVFFKKYYCIFISKKGRWYKFLVYIITSMSMQMSEGMDIWLYLSIMKEDRKGRESKTPGHLTSTIHLIMKKKDSEDWWQQGFLLSRSTNKPLWTNLLYILLFFLHSILHLLIPIRHHSSFCPVNLMLALTWKPT